MEICVRCGREYSHIKEEHTKVCQLCREEEAKGRVQGVKKAWEDIVWKANYNMTKGPIVGHPSDAAILAADAELTALREEVGRLREVLNVDHETLVNEDFDMWGWDDLTLGEKSMVRMTLAELLRARCADVEGMAKVMMNCNEWIQCHNVDNVARAVSEWLSGK